MFVFYLKLNNYTMYNVWTARIIFILSYNIALVVHIMTVCLYGWLGTTRKFSNTCNFFNWQSEQTIQMKMLMKVIHPSTYIYDPSILCYRAYKKKTILIGTCDSTNYIKPLILPIKYLYYFVISIVYVNIEVPILKPISTENTLSIDPFLFGNFIRRVWTELLWNVDIRSDKVI